MAAATRTDVGAEDRAAPGDEQLLGRGGTRQGKAGGGGKDAENAAAGQADPLHGPSPVQCECLAG